MINFNTQPLSQHVKNANIFNNVGLYGIMVAGFIKYTKSPDFLTKLNKKMKEN